MPDRVKCLHALAAHELAVPGANPLGAARRPGGRAAGGRRAPAWAGCGSRAPAAEATR